MGVSPVINRLVLAPAHDVLLAAAGFMAVSWEVLVFTASAEQAMLDVRGYLVHMTIILLAPLIGSGVVRRKPHTVFVAFLSSLRIRLSMFAIPELYAWTSVSITLSLVAGAPQIVLRALAAVQQLEHADT